MQLYSVLSLALAGTAFAKPCYNSSEPAGHKWWPAQLGDSTFLIPNPGHHEDKTLTPQ